ncbi:MAG: PAS domain-containing protein, partial [Planctomycetota bacterium]
MKPKKAGKTSKRPVKRTGLATIMERTPVLICRLTPEGKIDFINPAGENITGYASPELKGRDCWKILFPDEKKPRIKKLRMDMKKKKVRDFKLNLTRKTGAVRTLEWSSFPQRDDEGKLFEVIVFGLDVTARAEA